MAKRKNKQQSLNRSIKRGNVKPKVNFLTGFVELFRRTSTSKEHTVFIGQLDAKQQIDNVVRGLANDNI